MEDTARQHHRSLHDSYVPHVKTAKRAVKIKLALWILIIMVVSATDSIEFILKI